MHVKIQSHLQTIRLLFGATKANWGNEQWLIFVLGCGTSGWAGVGLRVPSSGFPRGALEVGRTSDGVESLGARWHRSRAGRVRELRAWHGGDRRAASQGQGPRPASRGAGGAGKRARRPPAPLGARCPSRGCPEPRAPARVQPLAGARAPRAAVVEQGGHRKVQTPDPQRGLCVAAATTPKVDHCSSSTRFLEVAPQLSHLLVLPSQLPSRIASTEPVRG